MNAPSFSWVLFFNGVRRESQEWRVHARRGGAAERKRKRERVKESLSFSLSTFSAFLVKRGGKSADTATRGGGKTGGWRPLTTPHRANQ